MPESLRRVLADPFSLGADLVPWEAPAVPPDSAKLRAAKAELERALADAPDGHVDWCLGKLFALPSRASDAEASAYLAESFLDACGSYPADLWTSTTTELLRTKKFRPSPAEFVELAEPKLAERRRMLERVRQMLDGTKPALPRKPAEQPIPTRIGRLEHLRSTYARLGRTADVERLERDIAIERGEVPAPAGGQAEAIQRPNERPPFVPADTPSNRRMRELAEAHRGGRPAPRPDPDAIPEAAA